MEHLVSNILTLISPHIHLSNRCDVDNPGPNSMANLTISHAHLNEDVLPIPFNPIQSTLLYSSSFFLLILLPLFLWSAYVMVGSRRARLINRFPGPPFLPFIGSIYMFLGPPRNFLPKISGYVGRYGRRFRIWKMHRPYLILLNAEDVESLLSSPHAIHKGRDYEKMHWMNGDGLITSGGETWREDRRLLNPSFKYSRHDTFLNSFNRHGKILRSILKEHFPRGSWGSSLDIHPALSRCTMDTVFVYALALMGMAFRTLGVLGTSFGIQESFEKDKKEDIGLKMYECTKSVMKSYRVRVFKPWLCLPIVRYFSGIERMERESKQCFTNAMIQVIKERCDKLRSEEKDADVASKATPFIDPLLLESRPIQNIVDHAFTIFAAGFETNATAMNFTLFLLALNPLCQEKVHAELDRVFNGDKRDASMQDLAELKYLEMCILETMRLFPPAPLLGRHLSSSDLILSDGTLIPKGCDVGIFTYELHNDPQVFPSPEDFDPERFLPEAIKSRHPYSFIPFSKGPRSCIGQRYAMMQMKTVLSHILRDFWVSTPTRREEIHIVYGTILEIEGLILLTLSPKGRHDKTVAG